MRIRNVSFASSASLSRKKRPSTCTRPRTFSTYDLSGSSIAKPLSSMMSLGASFARLAASSSISSCLRSEMRAVCSMSSRRAASRRARPGGGAAGHGAAASGGRGLGRARRRRRCRRASARGRTGRGRWPAAPRPPRRRFVSYSESRRTSRSRRSSCPGSAAGTSATACLPARAPAPPAARPGCPRPPRRRHLQLRPPRLLRPSPAPPSPTAPSARPPAAASNTNVGFGSLHPPAPRKSATIDASTR